VIHRLPGLAVVAQLACALGRAREMPLAAQIL
jgi:hypothetical protein